MVYNPNQWSHQECPLRTRYVLVWYIRPEYSPDIGRQSPSREGQVSWSNIDLSLLRWAMRALHQGWCALCCGACKNVWQGLKNLSDLWNQEDLMQASGSQKAAVASKHAEALAAADSKVKKAECSHAPPRVDQRHPLAPAQTVHYLEHSAHHLLTSHPPLQTLKMRILMVKKIWNNVLQQQLCQQLHLTTGCRTSERQVWFLSSPNDILLTPHYSASSCRGCGTTSGQWRYWHGYQWC